MEPIEGVVGKWCAKMLHYICLSRAHSSAAELPTPRFKQKTQRNFIHVQGRQAQMCAEDGVNR